ncbi:hypothetical protein K7432_000906 [Basidiobolus ranarum]|uniref:Uncharacterized protein n=1 Tax=Basidiobolus ranarum TaxID=34480 RepID=A0ABR2WAK1_9FUNG
MSDSDSDHTPVKPRRPQPKPRRFIKPVVSRGNSNLTSESTSSSQLSPQGTQEEQTSNEVKPTDDDFFCRAFTFRNSSSIVLEEEVEKEEMEEFGQLKSHTTKISVKEQQFETTELKVRRNLLVVTDSDDEVTFLDNVTEVKKRGNAIEEFERELSLTPPPEIVKPASKRRNTNDDDLLFLKEIPKTEVDGPLSTESFDTELDPELISVAQRAQQRGQVTKKDVYNAKVEVIVRTLVDTRTVTPQNMKKNARAHAPVKFVMRCVCVSPCLFQSLVHVTNLRYIQYCRTIPLKE